MGFPLRSRIFEPGTLEHERFRRFPLQVAIFFSPRDSSFVASLTKDLPMLDAVTGNSVAYYFPLDPPMTWFQHNWEKDSVRAYWGEFQENGYTLQDRPIIAEMALRFGIRWEWFPCLAVSNDLFSGKILIVKTGPRAILEQMRVLTQSAIAGSESLAEAENRLRDSGWRPAAQIPETNRLADLKEFYRKLENTPTGRLDERDVSINIAHTFQKLQAIRESSSVSTSEDPYLIESESLSERTIGDLVVPAVRNTHIRRSYSLSPDFFERTPRFAMTSLMFGDYQGLEEYEGLEETSLVQVETSIITRKLYLELPDYLRRISGNLEQDSIPLDYTPACQGLWKAFESELHFSIMQAARLSLNIKMPQYFAKYASEYSSQSTIVKTPRKKLNLNEFDLNDPSGQGHSRLMLGELYWCVRSLVNKGETFRNILSTCGVMVDEEYLSRWKRVMDLRNKGSHISPLSSNECENVWSLLIDQRLLLDLVTLKAGIKEWSEKSSSTNENYR